MQVFESRKRLNFSGLALLFVCSFLLGQDGKNIVLLKSSLNISKSDTQKIRLLTELSEFCPDLEIKNYTKPALLLCDEIISIINF